MAMTDRSTRDIRALLEDLYLGPSPPYRDEILRASAGIRQRPAWSFPAHWVPALAAGPAIPWRVIAVAALLAALLAGLTVVVGALMRDDQRTVPLEGVFIPAGPMALERLGGDIFAVGLSDGRVLIMGGHTEGNETRDVLQAEIFDPATGTFTATGSMQEAHGTLASATLLADGRVLIAGGWHPTESGLEPVGAEIYDPASGQFTATGPMVMARYGHTATLLEDGQVLIAGGDVSISGNDVPNPPAELFDPASGTFTAMQPLAVNRLYHTATRLSDGRVLLAGGHLAGRNGRGLRPRDRYIRPCRGPRARPQRPHSDLAP
jgi:hypothetical protein